MKSDEVTLCNMFIGLFIDDGYWPCPFADLGMRLHGVQRPLFTDEQRDSRKVVPEALLANDDLSYQVVLEVKSATVDAVQAVKYHYLTPKSIAQSIGVKSSNAQMHDVAYMTVEENCRKVAARLRSAVKALGVEADPFPIVIRSSEHLGHSGAPFRNEQVDGVLREGIAIKNEGLAPRHFVRFTSESPLNVLLPHVVQYVLGKVISGSTFTIGEACRSIVPSWEVMGEETRASIHRKVFRIVDRMGQEDFKPFLKVSRPPYDDLGTIECRTGSKKQIGRRLASLHLGVRQFSQRYSEAEDSAFTSPQLPLSKYVGNDSETPKP